MRKLKPGSLFRIGSKTLVPLTILLSSTTCMPAANACSVCIAHALGAGLHGLGAQTLHKGASVFSISFVTTGKTQDGDDPGTKERENLYEYGINYQYGLTNNLTLRTYLPYVMRSIKVTGQPEENTSGLGDGSVGLFYQLPASTNDKLLTAFYVDAKLPTGDNSRRDSTGALRDQHLQPGTGSTDLVFGTAFTGELNTHGELWFAGLRGRINGSNGHGYHYGSVVFYNVGYSHALSSKDSVVLELNGRVADIDVREDGTHDPDSGGHVGYLSVSYRRSLGSDFGVIATYQHPVMKNLNGSQSEGAIFSASLTRAF